VQADKFIPVAVEVSAMMDAKDATGDLFRKIAKEGHYGVMAATRTAQGTYLITPQGDLLKSGNTQNAKSTLTLMNDALAAWKKIPADKRYPSKISEKDSTKAVATKFPTDGLALDVSLRKFFPRKLSDSPVDAKVLAESGLPERLKAFAQKKPETYWEVEWNQDHAWFTKTEARNLLPEMLAKGQKSKCDPLLAARLARLHMLDTVRALADVYPDDAVRKAELRCEVTDVVGEEVIVRFEGEVHVKQSGLTPFARTADQTSPVPKKSVREYDSKLLGKATFNLKTGKYMTFELVALGRKTGGSKLSPFEECAMGVTFTMTESTTHDLVEPRYLSQYGWK
jgi:hypothetical protein